jgi:serine/threonine protein kinase
MVQPNGQSSHIDSSAATGEFITPPDGTLNYDAGSDGTGEFVNQEIGTLDQIVKPEGSEEHGLSNAETANFAVEEKPKTRPIPKSVAGYEIIKVLGRGAMGVVYKARQRGLKRLVALKMIISGEHASEMDLSRFQAEADAVAQLHHPGIVQIYEIGEDEGRPFFSLEFVDGTSLHKKLQESPLSPRESAALLQKMAEAMAYAHQRGVIHRDLKPANVLMTSDGIPKIGDFGLAKTIGEGESGLTVTGTVMGTPSYMSPEQASGQIHEVGTLADVYSLGAMLYDMLTGRPPFRGTTVMDTLQQLRTREPVPPMQLQPGVPRDLETICLKCLQKDRHRRYADAGALAADLQRFLNGEPILARPISSFERAWRWSKRNPFKAGTAVAALLTVVAFSVLATVYNRKLDFEKNEAVIAKGIAEEKKEEAEKAKKLAEEKEQEAKDNLGKAIVQTDKQRETARQATLFTIQFLRKLYNTMQSKQLTVDASPEIKKMRANILNDIRNSVDNVRRKIQDVASDTFTELLEAEQVAEMLMKLGHAEEPRELLSSAHSSIAMKVAKDPNNDRARANLGIIEQRLGDVALKMEGDARRALPHYLASRDLHEEVRLHPKSSDFKPLEIKISLAHDDVRVGRAYVALGQARKAMPFLDEALKYFTEWLESEPKDKQTEPSGYIFETQMMLGMASSHLGDAKGVDEHFGLALNIGKKLLEDFPDFLPFKIDNADSKGAYGDALLGLGKLTEAQKQYGESLQHLNEYFAKLPDDISQQPLMALAQERLGIVNSLLKREAEAKGYFKVAVQLRKELWEIEGSNLSRQIGYVLAMARTGERANSVPLTNTIGPRMVKSPELLLKVARCHAIFAADGPTNRKTHVEQALKTLKQATGTDFKDALVLENDPEFSVLRDEPAFKELITSIKARK